MTHVAVYAITRLRIILPLRPPQAHGALRLLAGGAPADNRPKPAARRRRGTRQNSRAARNPCPAPGRLRLAPSPAADAACETSGWTCKRKARPAIQILRALPR